MNSGQLKYLFSDPSLKKTHKASTGSYWYLLAAIIHTIYYPVPLLHIHPRHSHSAGYRMDIYSRVYKKVFVIWCSKQSEQLPKQFLHHSVYWHLKNTLPRFLFWYLNATVNKIFLTQHSVKKQVQGISPMASSHCPQTIPISLVGVNALVWQHPTWLIECSNDT